MSKSLLSLLAGIVIGYNGVRLFTHLTYLLIISLLLAVVILK